MEGQHAELAPSKGHRWIHCNGSVALCKSLGIVETTSAYAEEGTRAHAYAAYKLDPSKPPAEPDNQEMADFCQVYIDAVKRAAEGKMLFVEQALDISKLTGEKDAKGTSDAVVVDVAAGVVEIHDLKYGEGVVVYAEQNEQEMLYGLGVVTAIDGIIANIQTIKLVIHQPRRDHISEWTISKHDLIMFAQTVAYAADVALHCDPGTHLNPSAEACQWCPAKAACPALAKFCHDEFMKDFQVGLPGGPIEEAGEIVSAQLTNQYPSPNAIDLFESWVSAKKTAIYEALCRWESVPGWKLVAGRKGNRRWKDEAKVAELLKSFRLKQGEAYDITLKSPAQLEKLGLSKKRWEQVKEHITQNDAKPHMADEKDPKPAIEQAKPTEFEVVSITDISDLL